MPALGSCRKSPRWLRRDNPQIGPPVWPMTRLLSGSPRWRTVLTMSSLDTRRAKACHGKITRAFVSVSVLACALMPSCNNRADIDAVRNDVAIIYSAAVAWQIDHGAATCPTTRQIIAGKYLPSQTRLVDTWDQAYVISCARLKLTVTSLGPDRKLGTPDDIVVPFGGR